MSLWYWSLIFVLGIGWGSSFFFNEILLRELGPFSTSAGRIAFGALGCWLWLVVSRKHQSLALRQLGILAIFGMFQYTIPLTIYPFTQQFITSSAAGIVNAMTPMLVVVIIHMWPGGEKATFLKSVGVVVGFIGIVVVAWPEFHVQGESNPYALLGTITAPVCYAIALNLIRLLDGINRTVMTAWSLLFGSLAMVPFAFLMEGTPVITRPETWASLFFIGFVTTSAAFILLFWLIPRVGGTTASTITLIAPISSIWLGVVFLSEKILPIQSVGMAIIFLGLLFVDGRVFRFGRNAKPAG